MWIPILNFKNANKRKRALRQRRRIDPKCGLLKESRSKMSLMLLLLFRWFCFVLLRWLTDCFIMSIFIYEYGVFAARVLFLLCGLATDCPVCYMPPISHYLWITPEERCVSSGRRTRRLRCVGLGAGWVADGWAVLQLHIPPPQAGVGFEVTWPCSFAYKGFHSKRKTSFKDTLHMVL